MMNQGGYVVGLIVVASIGASVFWITSDDPNAVRTAHASDGDLAHIGAALTTLPAPYPGVWERFEHEKRAAPESELPAQF